jgi:hypothetical protein
MNLVDSMATSITVMGVELRCLSTTISVTTSLRLLLICFKQTKISGEGDSKTITM